MADEVVNALLVLAPSPSDTARTDAFRTILSDLLVRQKRQAEAEAKQEMQHEMFEKLTQQQREAQEKLDAQQQLYEGIINKLFDRKGEYNTVMNELKRDEGVTRLKPNVKRASVEDDTDDDGNDNNDNNINNNNNDNNNNNNNNINNINNINNNNNFVHIKQVFANNDTLVAPILTLCPEFMVILCFILKDSIAFRIKKVSWKSSMKNWKSDECRHVGESFAYFLRQRKTGEAAVAAWRLHYVQLNELFTNVPGFEDFIVDIARRTLKDSIYGTAYRVGVGAFLSMLDAVTDIYVITNYYQTPSLVSQANILVAMITTNSVVQLMFIEAQYMGRERRTILYEALITLFFLRPAVDAYRVSTNFQDDEASYDPLSEMAMK